MNLVQIQEHLRDLPMQALLGYANGMNPEVPPYVALNELHRRKRLQEAANVPQAPQGTVKDEVAAKAMGLGAIMPGLPPQGGMPMPGAPGTMPVNGGLPSPGMVPTATGGAGPRPGGMPAQPQPQNPAAQPNMRPGPMMAAGGLVGLNPPISDTMFSGGGLVSFAEGGNVVTAADLRKERDEAIAARDAQLEEGRRRLGELLKQAQPKDPRAAMAEHDAMRAERNATHGVAPGLLGEQVLADNERILQMQEAEDPNRAADLDRRRRVALFDALSRTRGTGRGPAGLASALGSFGSNINPALEAQIEEEAKLRSMPMQREQLRAQLRAKVDEARRALVEGDLKRFAESSAEAERLKRALAEEVGRFETKALGGRNDLADKAQSGFNQLAVTEAQGRSSQAVANTKAAASQRRASSGGGGGTKGALTEAQRLKAVRDARAAVQQELSSKHSPAAKRVAELTKTGLSADQAIAQIVKERVEADFEVLRSMQSGGGAPSAKPVAPAPTKPMVGQKPPPGAVVRE